MLLNENKYEQVIKYGDENKVAKRIEHPKRAFRNYSVPFLVISMLPKSVSVRYVLSSGQKADHENQRWEFEKLNWKSVETLIHVYGF